MNVLKDMARIALAVALVMGMGCADAPSLTVDTPVNQELGKPLMEAPPSVGKEDNAGGIRGPKDIFAGGPSEVWATPNRWEDRDTDAARQAGISWDEDSGLDWNEKYALWIESFKKITATPYIDTFELSTPWGFSLPAPVLECAEVAVFLRVAFASWYGLPFYLTAWSEGSNLHFGHFGVVRDDGADPRFPSYRNRYEDHSAMPLEDALAAWPTDTKLAKRYLTVQKDDKNTFLGSDKYSGAYFDRIFLNKRVGHFMVLVLTYTGSVHLASSNNTFNVKARSIREGDTLLKRWQKQGIGHTMAVVQVRPIEGTENVEVEIASGSMPRRQPKWESPGASKYSFLSPKTGGVGEAYDGSAYAVLGGGLKRWRVSDLVDGRWRNKVPANETDVFIPTYDTDAISERPAIFEEFLGEQTPQQKMDVLAELVESKRQHLRNYPASCSARIAREQAFEAMYELGPELTPSMNRTDIDASYRHLEDYVFAELAYEQSRTCCWNSTHSGMFQLIMDLNQAYMFDEDEGVCRDPIVFKMVDGDYSVFKDYAESVDASDQWVEWSADESCPQEETVMTDTEAPHGWVPYCSLLAPEEPVEEPVEEPADGEEPEEEGPDDDSDDGSNPPPRTD
jgi:hypothetical protein